MYDLLGEAKGKLDAPSMQHYFFGDPKAGITKREALVSRGPRYRKRWKKLRSTTRNKVVPGGRGLYGEPE